MARRRKKRTLRPRVPSRVKKRTRKGRQRNEQHLELIGLALVALGAFLAAVVYFGWSGGMAGGWISDGFRGAVGAAAYAAPVAFVSSPANCFKRSMRAQGGDSVLPNEVGTATQWPSCLPR